MEEEEDLRGVGKMMEFGRGVSIFVLVVEVYVYCYGSMRGWKLKVGVMERIVVNLNNRRGILKCIVWRKVLGVVVVGVWCVGREGVKGEKIRWGKIYGGVVGGWGVLFVKWWLVEVGLGEGGNRGLYIFSVTGGYVGVVMWGVWMRGV